MIRSSVVYCIWYFCFVTMVVVLKAMVFPCYEVVGLSYYFVFFSVSRTSCCEGAVYYDIHIQYLGIFG